MCLYPCVCIVVPGRWAVWCSSLCVAVGLWRWILEWTVWCGHDHSVSDMPRGSLLPPPGSLDPLHLSSGQCWQHWGCAGSPSCSPSRAGEDVFPGCWKLHLTGSSVKTKLTHNIVTSVTLLELLFVTATKQLCADESDDLTRCTQFWIHQARDGPTFTWQSIGLNQKAFWISWPKPRNI